MAQAENTIGAPALSTLAGYLAQRSNVCAKVIDRAGHVSAINKRGQEILETTAGDDCAEVWAAFWHGENREAAITAADCAFAGKPCEFVGTFRSGGTADPWEVEFLPLEWQDGVVSRVLVLSARLGAVPNGSAGANGAMQRDAGAAFRRLSEAMAVVSQGIGQLRAGAGAGDPDTLADSLQAACHGAAQAIEDLAALMGTNPRRDG